MDCRVKPVIGYDNYLVTEKGDVINAKTGKTLKKMALPSGYLRVKLYKNASPKMFMVHRLVATAFNQMCNGKNQVNHIDGNKANNSCENLEWVTQSENQIHAYLNGLNSTNKAVNANKKKVKQMKLSGELLNEWDCMSDASRALGIPVSNITHCCKGRIKQAGGFKWCYSGK